MSAIFRDTPRTPVEQAADWLEYVIRHGSANHLRSAAFDLHMIQYLLMDVITVLLVVALVFVFILYCSCKFCYRGCKRIFTGPHKQKRE